MTVSRWGPLKVVGGGGESSREEGRQSCIFHMKATSPNGLAPVPASVAPRKHVVGSGSFLVSQLCHQSLELGRALAAGRLQLARRVLGQPCPSSMGRTSKPHPFPIQSALEAALGAGWGLWVRGLGSQKSGRRGQNQVSGASPPTPASLMKGWSGRGG